METLTASGVLGLLGVIVFQMIFQLMMTYRILLCTEESKLIATQYVTCFQATGLCPENAIGTYADGTPYKIEIQTDTMRPFLKKMICNVHWTIQNKTYITTKEGLVCKW